MARQALEGLWVELCLDTKQVNAITPKAAVLVSIATVAVVFLLQFLLA